MTALRWLRAFAVRRLLLVSLAGAEKKATSHAGEYDGLKQKILQYNAQVVVVDFGPSTARRVARPARIPQAGRTICQARAVDHHGVGGTDGEIHAPPQ